MVNRDTSCDPMMSGSWLFMTFATDPGLKLRLAWDSMFHVIARMTSAIRPPYVATPGVRLARRGAAGRGVSASGRAAARPAAGGRGHALGDLPAGRDNQAPRARETAPAVVGVGRRCAVHVDVPAAD